METIEVQTQGRALLPLIIYIGGMMISGEDEKKKSAGGVFLALIKKSPL
jgi:hypothetical protein